MKLIVNAKEEVFDEDSFNISELLKLKNIDKKVIVELNGEILKSESFESVLLKNEDKLEILYFMGGG